MLFAVSPLAVEQGVPGREPPLPFVTRPDMPLSAVEEKIIMSMGDVSSRIYSFNKYNTVHSADCNQNPNKLA